MKKENLYSTAEIVAYVITVILSLSAQAWPSVDSNIVLFSGFALTQVVKTYLFQKETMNHNESLEETLNEANSRIEKIGANTSTIRLIENIDSAIEEISRQFDGAIEVKDTSIFYNLPNINGILKNNYTFLNKISKFLNDGKSIIHIGNAEYWINVKNSSEYINNLNRESTFNSQFFLLNSSYPVINFIIFKYKNSNFQYNKRIYFGWGRHKKDPNGHVFVSQDTHLIETFEKYFECLIQDSTETNKQKIDDLIVDKIVGHWVNVAFMVDENSQIEYWNHVEHDIEIIQEREVVTSGVICTDKGEKVGTLHSTSGKIDGNEVVFSYERTIVDSNDSFITNSVLRMTYEHDKDRCVGSVYIGGHSDEKRIFAYKTDKRKSPEEKINEMKEKISEYIETYNKSIREYPETNHN